MAVFYLTEDEVKNRKSLLLLDTQKYRIFEGQDYDLRRVYISDDWKDLMFKRREEIIKSNLKRLPHPHDMYCINLRKTTPYHNLFVELYIDIPAFENLVCNGNPIPSRKFFIYMVKRLNLNIDHDEFINTIMEKIPLYQDQKFPIPPRVESCFTLPKYIKLYQKENIKWMLNVEKCSDIPVCYSRLHCVKIGNIYVDVGYHRLYLENIKTNKINFTGGALIDESGLGKTLCIIALIVMNPSKYTIKDNTEPKNRPLCIAEVKSGKRAGEICNKKVKSDTEYCGYHSHNVLIEKTRQLAYDLNNSDQFVEVSSDENDTDLVGEYELTYLDIKNRTHAYDLRTGFKAKLTSDKAKLVCPATLVIVPNHLPSATWYAEINKFTDPRLRCHQILSKRDFDRLTYMDILSSEVIITTYNFLNNPVLLNSWKEYSTRSHDDDININEIVHTAGLEILRDPNILNKSQPILNLFYWHRIIYDEVHEPFMTTHKDHYRRIFKSLKSKYIWCLSGTPFPHGYDSFINITTLLTNFDKYNVSRYPKKKYGLDQYVKDNLFRRNTKNSVSCELSLPAIEEENVWLKLTDTERAMYDNRLNYLENRACRYTSDVYLRQLCCHPNISTETRYLLKNCKTLDEIHQVMTGYVRLKIDVIQEKINSFEQKTKSLVDQYNAGTDADFPADILEEYEISINQYKKSIDKLHKKLESVKKGLIYFANVIERIKENKLDMCCICYGKLRRELNDEDKIEMSDVEDKIGITHCGHMYHYDCLLDAVRENGTCPQCRKPIGARTVYMLKYSIKVNAIENEETLLKVLIQQNGTKMGHVIILLTKLLKETDDRVIIFSQWDNLLKLVELTLTENNIATLSCRGNVWAKNRAIKLFNEGDKYRIILLSSEYSASGTNLTKASVIIFLDPVYGSIKYKNVVENQAIGRSHRLGQTKPIKIYRFLIEDSVEEEIYKSHAING